MDENFQIMLQAVLDKIKSIANIKENIKAIEPKLPKIKLHGTLNKTEVKRELNTKLKSINPKVKIDADTTQAEKKIRKINQQKSNPTVTPTVDNSQVVSGLKQAQKETKTLWERFTNGIFGINLIRMGIQEVTRAIRQAISNIKELDAVKTNIQMVSGTSDSGANAMMSGYNSMAKDLSSTTKEVAEAANEFLRMGESVASTNELIKSSQVLSKVGMIESAEAAGYLISSLKGYKIAAENSMDVVSKLTSVDLEAAVSAGGLAEALSKCANIADNSGVAMNRLIGYTATVGETTQKSMSEVGNSFQALLSRMNNIKIGRFIDDETGESLSDTEAVLNKLGIQLRDTEDSYRSFDDVLDDVGSRWRDFTKVEQNAISVAIAGTRQRENFEALMNNYSSALKYAETAANSAGSALDRYGVYQDSIQAKTNELTAAMESLSTSVISEELYSGIIEATTGIVEFIDKTNLLKGTLAGLVAMGISKTIASIGAGFITAAKSTAQLTAAMALFDNGRSVANLKAVGAACKGLSDQQLKLVLSTKGLEYEDRELILAGMGVAEAEQQQTLTTLGFSAAEDKATISTFSLKGALNSLKTVIATNPIGVLVAAVSVATTVFSVYKQHQEEVRQATQEAANAYKESTSSIEDYTSRYEELHKALIAAKSNEEETYNIKKQLLELQTELNDKFGEECGTLDLVTNAYESQTEAIRNLNKEKARLFLNENKEGIDKAEKEMTKARHYNLSYTGLIGNTEKGEALKDIAEKYKEQGITLLDEYGDGTYLQFSIHLDADAQSAYETINAFENDLRDKAKQLGDEHMFDDVLDVSSDSLNKAKEPIENYGDTYKQALTAEIVSDDDKSKTYGEALKAVEAYNEAVLRSENPYDDQNVTQAKENLDAIKTSIQDNEAEWGKYSVLFDDVFEQADTRLLEFNEVLKTDSGLKELANDLEGLSDIDLQALDENVGENNSFDKLKEAAAGYKVNVDELIAALVRLGYVQGEVQGTGADTADFTDPAISLSISQTIDQLNTQLKPAFDSLKSAYQDIFTDDGFTLENVDTSMLSSIKSTIDELNNMEDVDINIDYSSFENLAKVLTDSSSTAEDVQNSFNNFASTILDAVNPAISQCDGESYKLLQTLLESMGIVRIDDQISSVNSEKDAVLSSIDEQIDAIETAKDQALEAIEQERQARLDAIEEQRKQIENSIKEKQKVIDGINAEIKAMKDANSYRKLQNTLMKEQYELERLQHQHTILQYSEDKGIHYVVNTKDIRSQKQAVDDAKLEIEIANKEKQIDLIEKEIDLLNDKLDILDEEENRVNDYFDNLSKQTEAYYDQQIKALEQQRKETEKFYSSITKNLENQKSKFQELTEILEKAELSAKLKQLGIDEEALLNGSEEEFEKLKNAYMNIVTQLMDGNDKVLDNLNQLSGYDGTAPAMLEDSNTKLDTMNTELGTTNTEVGKVNSSLDKTATTTGNVATNVSDVNTNIGETTGLVNEQKGAFDELKQTIDLIVDAINQKIQAIETGQSTVATAVGSEMANFQLLINKILEVKEKLDEINTTVSTMDRQPIDNLANAFQLLYDKVLLVSNLLGVGVEGAEEGAVSGIAGAIQALNEISLEEGIIAQFTMLKEAIDSVTAAISGGGGESSEGEGSGSGSGSGNGGQSGGKGSEGNGKGKSGGGNSLTGAIKEMGETAQEVIGEPDAEGDGTVIGEFGSMETAVNDVRDAIGTEGSEGGEGGSSSSGGETDDTLVGSIEYLGDKTEEEMGEPDGEGIIGKFNEFKNVIEEAANQVKSISEGLDEIDGKEVECTITINVKMNGDTTAFASGTVLGNMQIESATYNAKYGKAFASGTIGLKHDEKNALRSEYGQPELTVYPNGTTELTTSPVMSDLPKGTVIYNEEQTKKIMDNKANNAGSAHANGTNDGSWIGSDGHRYSPVQPSDPDYWLIEAGEKFIQKWKDSGEEFISNAYFEGQKQMEKWTKEITNNTAINNVVNNRNVQQPIHNTFNITMPNVTDNTSAASLMNDLQSLATKKFQVDW